MKKTEDISKGSWQTTQKIVDKIMSKFDKPFLTADRFKTDMEKAKKFFYKELERIATESRLELFVDYLRSNGFIVHQLSHHEHKALLTISKEMVHGILASGFALMVSGLADSTYIQSLVEKKPQFLLTYITDTTAEPKETEVKRLQEESVSVITNEDIVRFLMVLVLDRYFDDYFMTITTMPGLKEQIWSSLQTFGINYQMYEEIRERWQQITRELLLLQG